MLDSPWLGGPERRLSIFTGLATATRSSPRLAEVVRSEVSEPYVEVYRRLLERAADRGQIAPGRAPAIPVLAAVIPAMSTYRLDTGGEPVRREFYVALVDDVVLAALGVTGP